MVMPSTSYVLTRPWTALAAYLLSTLKWNYSVIVKSSDCNVWMHWSSILRCLGGGGLLILTAGTEEGSTGRQKDMPRIMRTEDIRASTLDWVVKQRQGDEGRFRHRHVLLDISCFEHRIYCLRTRLLCDCHACVLRGSELPLLGSSS